MMRLESREDLEWWKVAAKSYKAQGIIRIESDGYADSHLFLLECIEELMDKVYELEYALNLEKNNIKTRIKYIKGRG